MSYVGTENRVCQRIRLSLPIRLTGLDNRRRPWLESSRLIDVSPFGARFAIRRLTEPGRLIRLTLMMPRPLRCFDHVGSSSCGPKAGCRKRETRGRFGPL